MILLTRTSFGLARASDAYSWFVPGANKMFTSKIARLVFKSIKYLKIINKLLEDKPLSEIIGSIIGQAAMYSYTKPLQFHINRIYLKTQRANIFNTMSVRTWIDPAIDANRQGRIIKNMVIIYHDANKAKKHIDIHIGHLSFIMKISGKPVENNIKFNNKGELTQNSKDAIMDHIRQEIFGHSRVPQNLDHDPANAKCTWKLGKGGIVGYGSGATRQIVLEDKVEFYHTHLQSSLHLYAPSITPNQGLYLYKIYNGESTGVPICIWGSLIPRDENFKDRLHLNMIQEVDFGTFKEKTDASTTTRKYDGASTYFSTTGQGFKFFSPRYSKITGHRIEYTYKLPELAEWGFGPVEPDRASHTQGMGEVLFYRRSPIGHAFRFLFSIKGPEGLCWNYLEASEIGGVLNSHQVRSTTIYPEVRVYRLDRFLGKNVSDLSFIDNRILQKEVVSTSKYWNIVQQVRPVKNINWEGLVAIPKGLSINNGYKIKWWGDQYDWRVERNELNYSDKGNIQGVIHFTSLESGKAYALGPGQLGNFDECVQLLRSKGDIVGRVAKIHGRIGHEGRAAKFIEWHQDKGIA